MVTDFHPSQERSLIAVLGLTGMLVSLQMTLLIPALPEIPQLLSVTATDASWLVTVTLLTSTVGTPIISRMADMYGRRRMMLVSLILLFAGSLIAATSLHFPLVLMGRSLQGFASSIIPIGVSLMREHLSPHRAATGVALMSGTMGIGSATGLPLSGVLTKFGGLGAIFWASAVASAIFFALTFAVVPRHGSRTGGAFDAVGTVLFTISLTALLLFISKGGEWGVSSPTTLTTLGVAIVAFSIWIRHQFVTSSPLVDLRSSLSRPILTTNVASFFISVGMFSNYLLTIQEARAPVESEIGLGLSGLAGGAILIPSAVAMIVLSPVAARVLVRFGGKTGLVGGAVVILLAYAFRLVVPGTLLTVVAGTLAIGIGTTFAFAAMPTLIMDWVESEKAAAANGLNSLIRNLAGAVTTAAYGFLFVLAPWQADPTYLSRQGLLLGFAAVCACSLIGIGVALSLPRSPSASPKP